MPMKAVPQPCPPTDSMTLAATTLEKTSTDPMDRSMPDVMMTKVMPTPEHGPDRDVLRDQREVRGGEELASGRDGEERHDHEQDSEDPDGLGVREALQEGLVPFVGVRDCDVVGFRDDAHAAAPFLSRAPVMAPTSSSTLVSEAL